MTMAVEDGVTYTAGWDTVSSEVHFGFLPQSNTAMS